MTAKFLRLLAVTLVIPPLLSVATCGAPQHGASATSAPVVAQGEELYGRYCALCHGTHGQGYAADNANALQNPEFLSTASDEFLKQAILHGRRGTPMSAWGESRGGPLSPEQADAIVALLRSWQERPSVTLSKAAFRGNAQNGAALFAKECADCHGSRGQGKTAPTLHDPGFQATASDAFLRFAIEHGRSDTPMPAFEKRLDQTQIKDLIAHIRSLKLGARRKPVQKPAPLPIGPLVINPDGPKARFTPRDDMYVPAKQVKAALDRGERLIIADARAQSDYLEAHIPGAISLPFYEVDRYENKLPKDGTWIIAYCACPHAASGRVARALRQRGFKHTGVLDEGILVWMREGYPIKRAE